MFVLRVYFDCGFLCVLVICIDVAVLWVCKFGLRVVVWVGWLVLLLCFVGVGFLAGLALLICGIRGVGWVDVGDVIWVWWCFLGLVERLVVCILV